jgi:hypothetical protein
MLSVDSTILRLALVWVAPVIARGKELHQQHAVHRLRDFGTLIFGRLSAEVRQAFGRCVRHWGIAVVRRSSAALIRI